MTEDLPVWKWYERLERPARWDPVSVSPESYADLDLMLVFAPDEGQRWQALVAGTIEVLNRFDHLTQWRASCPTAADVSEAFSGAADRMAGYCQLASAVRLAAEVLDQQEEHRRRDAAAMPSGLRCPEVMPRRSRRLRRPPATCAGRPSACASTTLGSCRHLRASRRTTS
jgi:hypothetical protein